MKTLFVSFAALVAISGAALASDRNDPRDSDINFSKFSKQNTAESYVRDSNAFAVVKPTTNRTSFERMKEISEENQQSGKENGASHRGAA
jgi:hypothetical protein